MTRYPLWYAYADDTKIIVMPFTPDYIKHWQMKKNESRCTITTMPDHLPYAAKTRDSALRYAETVLTPILAKRILKDELWKLF
jgi:hypothetical protein